MTTLCTYADPNEFPDLCEALGDRIMETGSPKDASFCFLVGSKLEKVITIWLAELQETEKVGVEDYTIGDSTFSIHARSLQNFIEKVTVFREVTKFQDTEKNSTSDWKLAPLYEKYAEYADIVAAHGHLSIAERYLDLLPTSYPAAEVSRNRVKLASRKEASKAQAPAARSSARPQGGLGYQPLQTPAVATPAAIPATNPYAPTLTTNPYAPTQGYQPPQPQGPYGAPPQAYGYPNPNPGYGAPPPSFGAPPPRNTTPSAPPPSRAKNGEQWNDLPPMATKVPLARRSTPNAVPITNPFPGQTNLSMPPAAPPYGGQRGTPTPPPPPPKGPAPPRMTSPLTGGPPQSFQARPSSAVNTYSPSASLPAQQFSQPVPPPTVPRGASPYNAPPAGPPSFNRYAPSPVSQQYNQPPTPPSQVAPPQAGIRPPPPANPYAPPSNATQNQYAPSPFEPSQAPPTPYQNQGPPLASQGPPQGSRPGTGPPPNIAAAPPPSKPKYPAGDRSHIPPSAQRMVDIFGSDMQRVASKAPPSFVAQVKDSQKRLNILFDHLNNEELVMPDTIQRLSELAEALQSKNYEAAEKMRVAIQTEKTDECGNWMVGVKRLVSMSKVTP